MNAIEIRELTKKYKDIIAVDQLNLQVKKGELFSLLGVNGAGKTTTIKMLSCLTQPTSGDAFLNGKSICKNTAAVKSLIAVSPQETAVAPGLSVKENLALMCGVHGFTKDAPFKCNIGSKNYEIYSVPSTGDVTYLSVPLTGNYEISGDGSMGYIITIEK